MFDLRREGNVRKSGTISTIHFDIRKHVHVKYTSLLYGKTGVCRGTQLFLFLLQNIDCGYSLELQHQGGSNV